MEEIITNSQEETKSFAKNLAKKINGGVIALSGELGAGKTTFVQGFAEGLGIKDKIISPTFVLVRQHNIPNTSSILYHIDLYRLEDQLSINSIGLEDFISDPKNIVIIEWSEKLEKLPKGTIKISIQKSGPTKRRISLN